MNRRIPLNGSDWLFKDFYGEDWRWHSSHLPGSRDRRGWRIGWVPGCPHHDLWTLGEIENALKTEVSRQVSEALAEVTARVLKVTGQNRLVVAGGETSAAVCDRLGVSGMRVWKEIQPGLPSCVSLDDPPRMPVLKSGSFGKADFFERALEHLRES